MVKLAPGLTAMGLATVRLAPAMSVVPLAMERVPLPNDVALPKITVPPFKLNPLLNVLAAFNMRAPVPVFVRDPVDDVITALMLRPSGERPEPLLTGAGLRNTR